MSDSLRRSSRRAKNNVFKVGAIVVVTKGNATAKGRLVSQIEGSPSVQSRWLVTYDDDAALVDEELFESSFGSILSSDTESSSPPAPAPAAPTPPSAAALAQTAAATAARKKNRKNGRFVKTGPDIFNTRGRFQKGNTAGLALYENDAAAADAADKKSVSFSHDSTAASDSSALSNGKRTSAREQRTARRSRIPAPTELLVPPQEHQQEQEQQPHPDQQEEPHQPQKKRPPAHSGGGGPKASNKKPKVNGDEEVVKVPMLTGTLYLYKGIRRRVEFIRKY